MQKLYCQAENVGHFIDLDIQQLWVIGLWCMSHHHISTNL